MTNMPVNTPRQVLFASMIGTTIEFFDFYIYATAAVLVFPRLFFPASDPASATLASLATFGIAFLARPVGSALFGHFGDRIGRKTTLVIALSTMGVSTVAIGALPTYRMIGFAAPVLLALCRFGQGLGLGGEWGGAVLLAIENAPPGKRAWYGMFPQLGAPIGFFLSGGIFLALSRWLTDKQFFAFGWRLPFLASAVLVFLGLYVRLTITETPVFQEALKRGEKVKVPMLAVFRDNIKALVAGILVCLVDVCSLLPDDGLHAVVGHQRARLQPWKISADAVVRHLFLCAHYTDLCGSGGARTSPRDALGNRSDRHLRPDDGADVCCWHHRRGGDDGIGTSVDGPHLRTARHRDFRTVSDASALHGQLACLQLGRYLGRFAGALYRHLAGENLWTPVRRLLPFRIGGPDVSRAAFDTGNKG